MTFLLLEAIDPSVGAVLCGFDMHMNYTKLCNAFKHITLEGAEGLVLAEEKGEDIWPWCIIQSIGDLAQWKSGHVNTTGLIKHG